MGWFDDQIREKIKSDQEVFEDSIFNMAASVVDSSGEKNINDKRFVTRKAVEEIIKYYGFKPKESESDLKDVVKSYGIMYRQIKLQGDWYEKASGPMLAYYGEEREPIALMPKQIKGYEFYDYKKGRQVRVDHKNSQNIREDAYCFYKPLPARKLGMHDLVQYAIKCLAMGDLIVLSLLLLTAVIISMLGPVLTEIMTGFVLEQRSVAMLVGTALLMIVAQLTTQIIQAFSELMEERIDVKMSVNVEAATMSRVLSLPTSFYKKFSSGELSSRVGSVSVLCRLVINNILTSVLSIIFSMAYFIQIADFAPELVVPSMLILGCGLLATIITIVMQAAIETQIMEHTAHEDGICYALVVGVQKIRLAGAEKRAFAKWANFYSKGAKLEYSPPLFLQLSNTIQTAITIIGTIVIFYLATKSGVEPSEYIAFTTAYGLVSGAFNAFAQLAVSTGQVKPILELAKPILEAEPENAEGKTLVDRLQGNIELNNIHFRYDENSPYVFEGLSLKVKAGEYVAIVGKSGCGKSTLVRLLLGFEKPEKGAIYYDHRDINRLELNSLRKRIGVVTQNGTLFQGDIYSNIVISAPTLSLDDAWEAADIAGIADDISQMPMGMFTYISEGQGGISGGQKQRLMIARAVAPRPKVLILDEATSALDNLTQKKVSDALDRMNCTRIVIAHRLSTIRNCDRIIVIDGGKIVEEGTYDDLIARKGHFSDLVQRQQL